MRKKIFLFLASALIILLLTSSTVYAGSEIPVPKRARFFSGDTFVGRSTEGPELICDTNRATLNENFYLSWNVDAEQCVLYKSYNEGSFDSLGYVESIQNSYICNETEIGKYSYVLMTYKETEGWKQSNSVDVTIYSNEGISLSIDPLIKSDRTRAMTVENFYLSWNVDADYCILYKSYNDGSFENLGYVDTFRSAYRCNEREIGVYSYVIMSYKEGEEWKQSNFANITVYETSLDIDPILTCDVSQVMINENFYLSWSVDADQSIIYRSYNNGSYEILEYVDTVHSSYVCNENEIGQYSYMILTRKGNEEWKQSNIVNISVYADEETSCTYLEKKGMTNTWNLLFMVYRTAHIGDFEKSFTDAQIASVKRSASEMKYTMEGLSENKMKIGTVDVIVVDEPVTSASGPVQYGGPATLTYGNDGDVDFTYIMDHKDITLVAVFVPLLGFNNQYGWLGLGGTTMNVRGQEIYTVIINDIDASSERIECYGNEYLTASLACVHEILHAVEANSRNNGWTGFQDLHSGDDNGYGNGTYYWYHLLMTNTMDNGNLGFLRQSYYVKHRSISSSKRNGRHLDYDGIYRYYINGLPHIIDLYLPEMLTAIESEAFLDTKVKSVYIPSSVNEIGENAFNLGTLFYVKKGSYAETWASKNRYTFVQISN